MSPLLETARSRPLETVGVLLVVGWLTWALQKAVLNIYFHPLSKFPGPKLAAATSQWKAFVEIVLQQSFCHKLEDLHAKYGDVVRVAPNELHFANPEAYHDIYNNKNRWDKEEALYRSFGEDRSSFGFLTYQEAKERKDVLNKTFSTKAIGQAESLVIDKINALADVFEKRSREGKTVDVNYGYRCMTMDIITYLCFGTSVDAIHEPDFQAPIVIAMDASGPAFVIFRNNSFYRNMIMNCPPELSKVLSPPTAGLVSLQQILKKQIKELTENPERLDYLPHQMTIYHRLMTPEAYRNGTVPVAGSLYEEAQALMFGGGDTSGSAMMLGTYYLLKQEDTYKRLKSELQGAWPSLTNPPSLQQLERLPYLNAVIKEALRMSNGVVSGLLRVVPEKGDTIDGKFVPGGTHVSCGSTFVHFNADRFPSPHEFKPERWIDDPSLDNWLVAFSRGPRSCLGLNLAWMELRLTFATIFRRFDMELDPSSPKQLLFRDCFLPHWLGNNARAKVTPAVS